jgi:hypothetical protein
MFFRVDPGESHGVLVEIYPDRNEPNRTNYNIFYYDSAGIWSRFFENYGHVYVPYTDDISFSVTVGRYNMSADGAQFDADGNIILKSTGTISMTVSGGSTVSLTDVHIINATHTTTETFALSRVN